MLGVQACVSEELGAGTQCDSSRLGAEQTVESLIHSTSATVTGMLMILMPLTVCLLGSLRLHCRSLLLLLVVVVVVLVPVVAAAGSGGGVVVAASIGAAVADAAAPSAVAAATKTH